jgi:flagellin-like hook-associated protein FlgL
MDQLKSEINRIADSANFNGIKLLDGSLDTTVKTKMNEIAKGFGIAEWVGSNELNASAAVGTGTILHTGSKEAAKTEFAVEFNNSTVSGKDGVSITLGENEKISLDGTEIAQGASAEEIAAAFEKKLGGTIELKSNEGEMVKFDVKADGDRLVFTQTEAPTAANQIVNGNMAVTYEGIGSGAADTTERLNTTAASVTVDKPAADAAKTATTNFTWGANATDEQKDALNKLLADGVKLNTTVSTATGAATYTAATLDISKLTKALGDDYEVVVTGASGKLTPDTSGVVTDTNANPSFSIAIRDKASADTIATIGLGAITEGGATPAPAANKTYSATVNLKAGDNQAMNTKPLVTVDDGGKMEAAGTPLLDLSSATADQLNALNKVLGDGDQTITLKLDGLAGNATATTSKLTATLSDALKDAGYTLAPAATNANVTAGAADGDPFNVAAANAVLKLELKDKDNNVVGTISINGANTNTALNSNETKVTLAKSAFNQEATVTNGVNDQKVSIGFEAAPVADGQTASKINEVDWSSSTADVNLRAGDKFTFNIDGQDYTIEVKDGGLTAEEKASGKYLDISDTSVVADTKANNVLTGLKNTLQKQLDKAAEEAAKGNKDFNKVTNLTFTGVTGENNRINITATTQKHVYVGDTAADDPNAPGAATPGGKDPNASTVNIKQGNVADDGRLASTYITAEQLAGLKDGSQLRVGDKVYTFAVGKDSTVKAGEDVVDLTDLSADDADLLNKALVRLTQTANPNAMFSVGKDQTPGKVTFTENKDYTWGEGVDLSTHKGIAEQFGFYVDGMSTESSGKSLNLQIGDTSDPYNQMKVSVGDMHTDAMGTKDGASIADIDISTQEGAAAAVDVIKNAINYVSGVRGDLGAIQNRLEHTANNLSVMAENIQDAESTIRDTDIAEEMMAYTKNNILVQSAQAMLAQANQVPQGVLQLLG